MTRQPTSAARDPSALRVALFSGNYNYVMDGPVRALNKLVAHIEERGHAALVFAPTIATPAFEHSGELVSVPSLALPGSRSEYRFGLGLRPVVKRRLEAFAPNLVHIAAPDLTGHQALGWAERNDVTPVASFHTRFDTYPRYYGAAWLEPHVTGYMRKFYARCRHVYAPSESMADELRRDGIGQDIRLWTRGVDHALFNPQRRDADWRRSVGFADDDIVVAFVGRVVLEKGIEVFAKSILKAREREPRIRALVVGEGPERSRFQALLPEGVFTGYQQNEPLARSYASADVFFNPSVTETFGNVTLEAMACGLPSLGARASGSRSLIEDGATGLLSDPSAGEEGYAERLRVLAADPDMRRRFAAEAHRRSLGYSWPAVLDALLDDYREAIIQRKS